MVIQRSTELQDVYKYSHSSGKLMLCDVEDFRHHPDTVAGIISIHASLLELHQFHCSQSFEITNSLLAKLVQGR